MTSPDLIITRIRDELRDSPNVVAEVGAVDFIATDVTIWPRAPWLTRVLEMKPPLLLIDYDRADRALGNAGYWWIHRIRFACQVPLERGPFKVFAAIANAVNSAGERVLYKKLTDNTAPIGDNFAFGFEPISPEVEILQGRADVWDKDS